MRRELFDVLESLKALASYDPLAFGVSMALIVGASCVLAICAVLEFQARRKK